MTDQATRAEYEAYCEVLLNVMVKRDPSSAAVVKKFMGPPHNKSHSQVASLLRGHMASLGLVDRPSASLDAWMALKARHARRKALALKG